MDFIKKINKYLLEHYPTIWNTRLIWMVLTGILTHVLFFVIGYLTVNNQMDIQSEYSLSEFYYGTSVVWFNVLLSLIIVLIWIVFYLQNNAFKNLYTLKKGTLFLQFVIIIAIIFMNITQFYSFKIGLKLKIRNLYTWEEIDEDIKEFNKTAVFLIQHKNQYNFEYKKYPEPFPLEHEKVDNVLFHKKIDTSKAYFEYDNLYYQFYKIDTVLLNKDLKIKKKQDDAFGYENKNIAHYDFKYRIVKDVSKFKEDINDCLLNYGGQLYGYGQDSVVYENRLKYYEELFNRADESEIKENLKSFLRLADKYGIHHNLKIDDWYRLLDENNYTYTKNLVKEDASTKFYEIVKEEKNRKNYQISQFILTSKLSKWEEEKQPFKKTILSEKRLINQTKNSNYKQAKTYSSYKEVILSEAPYCSFGNLDHFFSNTYKSYQPNDDKEIVFIFLTIAVFCGLLLFLFKITDIKTLLLSFVAAAVVMIITGLSVEYIPRIIYDDYSFKSIVEKVILFLATLAIIALSIISLTLRWKKIITAILFSLAIFTIPVLLISFNELIEAMIPYKERYTNLYVNFMDDFGFVLVLIIWIIGIALYTKAIRKWKGLPE